MDHHSHFPLQNVSERFLLINDLCLWGKLQRESGEAHWRSRMSFRLREGVSCSSPTTPHHMTARRTVSLSLLVPPRVTDEGMGTLQDQIYAVWFCNFVDCFEIKNSLNFISWSSHKNIVVRWDSYHTDGDIFGLLSQDSHPDGHPKPNAQQVHARLCHHPSPNSRSSSHKGHVEGGGYSGMALAELWASFTQEILKGLIVWGNNFIQIFLASGSPFSLWHESVGPA